MTSEHILEDLRADLIRLRCLVCNEGMSVPNKGLGRAVAATWRTRHQHNERQGDA